MPDELSRSWDRQTDEPEVWFRIFTEYYLPLGNRRSLRNAFEFYIRVENPLDYEEVDPNDITYIPKHWNEHAIKFEWAARALDYDESKLPEFGDLYVSTVLKFLQANALSAGRALVSALKNDRTRVQAANSILNRIGVPEVTEVNVRGSVTFTADDMAQAKEKLEQWRATKTPNPSG